MDFNTITNTSSWGQEADRVNENFQKTGSEIDKLWNTTESISSGQVTLGTVANLAGLYAKADPVKGDRYIVTDQKNPANNLPYYYVYKGNSSGQTGNIPANWQNTGETIMNADAATKADLADKADITNAQGLKVVYSENGEIPEVDLSGLAPKKNAQGNEVVYGKDGKVSESELTTDLKEKIEDSLSKSDMLEIDGIGYTSETSGGGFDSVNLNDNFTPILGKYPIKGKPTGINSRVGYTENFIKVTPNEQYYCSTDQPGQSIIAYSSDNEDSWIKDVALDSTTNIFVAPEKCEYIRFIFLNPVKNGGFLVQRFDKTATIVNDNLRVMIGIDQIHGSLISTAEIEISGVFSKNTAITKGALNTRNEASIERLYCTDYEAIKPNTTYTCNSQENYAPTLWVYDINRIPLYYLDSSQVKIFTTPRNAAFVRLNLKYSALGGVNIFESTGNENNFVIPNLVIPEKMIVKETGNLTPIQAIPTPNEANSVAGEGWFGYADQSVIQGKHIANIIVEAATNHTLAVGFSTILGGTTLTWVKQIPVKAGKVTIPINKVLPSNEFLQINGSFKFHSGANNPIGGSINSKPNTDLSVEVYIYESNTSAGNTKKYYALGDSITIGAGATKSYPLLLATEFDMLLTNLASSGQRVFGGGLLGEVNLVPVGFSGLVTILIGINDYTASVPLGSVEDAISKKNTDLSVHTNFAEGFRLSLETLLLKAPDATIVVLMPLKAYDNSEVRIDNYRNIQRGLCEYLAVPVIELHEICKISPPTYSIFMPDKLHPNDKGHEMIKRVLVGELGRFFQFKK